MKEAGIPFDVAQVNEGSTCFPRRVQVLSVNAANEAEARAVLDDIPSEAMFAGPTAGTPTRPGAIVGIQLALIAVLVLWAVIHLMAGRG